MQQVYSRYSTSQFARQSCLSPKRYRTFVTWRLKSCRVKISFPVETYVRFQSSLRVQQSVVSGETMS